jgi:hypothetical protein
MVTHLLIAFAPFLLANNILAQYQGFVPVGNSMAKQLAADSGQLAIYHFAFFISHSCEVL